jgi:diguanylate cyclase (GGDEF)-like protein/PAS domain S-box-containing protein
MATIDQTSLVPAAHAGTAEVVSMRGKSAPDCVSADRLLRTLDSLADAVLTTDAQGRVDFMNPSAQVLLGVNFEEVAGQHASAVFNAVTRDNTGARIDPIKQCLANGQAVTPDNPVGLLRRDGTECHIEFSCTPIDDGCAGVAGAALVFRDVTEKHAQQAHMSWAARHDALTGLINRPEFEARLQKLLEHASVTGHVHALCYIDLDHFKRINDGFGHVAGDEFLKAMTAVLRNRIRGADTVARLGGDEFAVLLYSCPVEKAKTIADGLAACIGEFKFDWKGHELNSTCSVGVVEINRQTTDLTELLASVDVACYAAKNDGGNRVKTYQVTDTMVTDRMGEIHWLRCMQHAITHNRFLLYSQPIVPAGDMRLPHGSELLLRLQDDNGKVFTPVHFMPAALRYHVLADIERWIARKVIKAVSRRGHTLRSNDWTSLNISGQSILDDRFLQTLLGLIKEHALPPERLCFEIAETFVVEHMERARHFARQIKDAGCRVAIDDCGALIGSFVPLRQIPMDYIKVSETIIRNLAANAVDREITVALTRIAHRLGIRTIAECVSDVATLLEVRRLGVDYVQGHVIAEPRAVDLQVNQDPAADEVA